MDGVNGWQYGTEKEFADRLKMYLEHPEIRPELSQGAIRISRGFSVSSFAERVEAVYREQIMQFQAIVQEVSA